MIKSLTFNSNFNSNLNKYIMNTDNIPTELTKLDQ